MISRNNALKFASKLLLLSLFINQPICSYCGYSYHFNLRTGQGTQCDHPKCEIFETVQSRHSSKHRKSKINITNTNDTISFSPQLEILEKKNFTKSNISQMIEIELRNNTQGELLIKGPHEYRINFSSEGLQIAEEDSKFISKHLSKSPKKSSKHSKGSKGSKKSSRKSPKNLNVPTEYPIKLAINNLAFHKDTEQEPAYIHDVMSSNYPSYDFSITSESILKNKSAKSKKSSKKRSKSGSDAKSSSDKDSSIYFRESNGESIISKNFYQDNVESIIGSKHSTSGRKHGSGKGKKPSMKFVSKKSLKSKKKSLNTISEDTDTEIEGYYEYLYPLGFFRLFIRVPQANGSILGGGPGPSDFGIAAPGDVQTMQISLIDERLSIQADKGNPGEVAKYFDNITMSPVEKITDIKDIIERVNVSTLNQDLETIRNVLLSLPHLTGLKSALNLLHPAKFADLSLILFNNHSLLYSNICRHFEELTYCCPIEKRYNVWVKAFGNFQHMKTNSCITGYNDQTGGVFVGLDYFPTECFCLGTGFAYTYDDVKWHRKEADALINSYYGFLYSALTHQRFFLEAIGSFSYSHIDAHRFIRASEFLDRKADHKNHALTYGGRINLGFNFDLPCAINLQVFDAVDLGNVENKAFKEHGACALNLHVHKYDSLHVRNELGLQISKDFHSTCQSTCWTPAIGLKWVYQNPLSGRHVVANFQHQHSTFRLKTRNNVTNQVSPEASITATSEDGLYLSTYYEGAFGDGWTSNEFGLHFGKSF